MLGVVNPPSVSRPASLGSLQVDLEPRVRPVSSQDGSPGVLPETEESGSILRRNSFPERQKCDFDFEAQQWSLEGVWFWSRDHPRARPSR